MSTLTATATLEAPTLETSMVLPAATLAPTPTTATILDGKALAEELRGGANLQRRTGGRQARLHPAPVVSSVRDDPASRSYITGIKRACERVGIAFRPVALEAGSDEPLLSATIAALNADREVCGVLVTLLPAHLSPDIVATTLAPEKDIDGITLIGTPVASRSVGAPSRRTPRRAGWRCCAATTS